MGPSHHVSEHIDHGVPHHIIDLSLKPSDRYKALAQAHKPQIEQLTQLFNDLLRDLLIPQALHGTINFAARMALRRLHSRTETEELRGISEVAGVPMYLLVSFNVVLDLLMGCTSGGVRTFADRNGDTRMLHFRTLDWGMDPLRAVVVQLDFIKSKSARPQEVLASSVTYIGFVGVLTGVRPNLSVSLNFRAVHNARNVQERIRFRLHHVLVLLGIKQSIASLLRELIIPDKQEKVEAVGPKSLAWMRAEIPKQHSTAAYLIFSDGSSTMTIEKDFDTGVVRESKSFIALTNHDLEDSAADNAVKSRYNTETTTKAVRLASMEGFLDESEDRRRCITHKWNSRLKTEWRRTQNYSASGSSESAYPGSSTRMERRGSLTGPRSRTSAAQRWERTEQTLAIRDTDVVEWVSAWVSLLICPRTILY